MRKTKMVIFIALVFFLCIEAAYCSGSKEYFTDFVKNNKEVFTSSDSTGWNLTYKKKTKTDETEKIIEEKVYSINFNLDPGKSKSVSEVAITNSDGTRNCTFDEFLSLLKDLQKNFYSENGLHKLEKNNPDKKISTKGSPYATRNYKNGVYDEIFAEQTVIIKDRNTGITEETIIFLELEKQFEW